MEPEDKVVKRIQDKKTRIQKVQELHKRNAKKREEELSLTKAHYLAEQGSPVILDILAKAKSFAAYHTRIAQDGVGYRSPSASAEPEVYHLTNEKRVSELDRAAGILELVEYIERQFKEAPKKPEPEVDVETAVDEDFVAEGDETVADLT